MARFLTPPKVGLLALISLYLESVVPTDATIPILSFTISQILSASAVSKKTNDSLDLDGGIDLLRNATIGHGSIIPGRTIWDLLLKKLWEINSFDALHTFIDSLSALLPKSREQLELEAQGDGAIDSKLIRLSRNSPLGVFVRRAQLEFTRLQLHDSISLWKVFVIYRKPTFVVWKRRSPNAGTYCIDINLDESGSKVDGKLSEILYGDVERGILGSSNFSTDDVETLLEFQIDQMQKRSQRLPAVMKSHLESLFRAGVTIPSLSHYVKFLDSWRTGDYPSSFDHLHRYFDYTMHTRDRTFYQYALLNLAILQADFGCFSEALAAMQESISAARENKDMGCLNYSLSWLYHFGKAYPDEISEIQKSGVLGTDKEALAFLKSKAKETGMWNLLSTSFLSEAKLSLTNGESMAGAFENVLKSSHLNVTKDIPTAVGSQKMMASALFSRLGLSHLAWSQVEIFLECYGDQAPVEDSVHFTCKSAMMLAVKGRHEQALEVMAEVNPEALRILKHQQYWSAYMALLNAQRAIWRGNHNAASDYLALANINTLSSQDLSFTTRYLKIILLLHRKEYSLAMKALDVYFDQLSNRDWDIHQRIKLMILKARIWDQAGIPQKGFSIAIRAASLAHKARILPSIWEALGALCRVLNSLREFDASVKLLRSVVPQVLECEDCELAGRTFAYLADAHMGLAGSFKTESSKCKDQMSKALESLGRGFDEFQRIGDVRGQCEMLMKRATIMRLNGDVVLANDCASRYLDILKKSKEWT